MNHIASPDNSDSGIERQIKALGADKAPRVTPEDLQANIVSEHYFTAENGVVGAGADPSSDSQCPEVLQLLTFCVIVCKNGFTVVGKSAVASPENFKAEIGRQVARTDAINQMWPLMGYELKERLYRKQQAISKGSTPLRFEEPAEADFLASSQACDLSGEGTCESCQ